MFSSIEESHFGANMSHSAPDIVIRDLVTLDDFHACVALQEETWGRGFSERVPAAILKVGQRIGGVSAGAFEPAGRMVGFVFGVTGVRDGRLVHWSDMLAVRESYRGRHLGERLKHYQRDKVRQLGVEEMLWTYDPLVARNAHLNIDRLGAFPVEYVVDMYGADTGSALHGALPTDRFVISWDLTGEPGIRAPAADPAPAGAGLPLLNPVDASGLPQPPADAPSDTPGVRVQIPRDLQAEQAAGGDRALRWRLAVRAAIVPALRRGLRVTHFVRGAPPALPYYVLTVPDEQFIP